MSGIETFLLGGNQAIDLISLNEEKDELKIWIAPCGKIDAPEEKKGYLFRRYKRKYMELLLPPNEELEPCLAFCGGNAYIDRENSKQYFWLNFDDFEIGFWAEWPEKIKEKPVGGINFVTLGSTT